MRKNQRHKPKKGYNTHHILHYRRWWSDGHRQLLRRAFVYELPIDAHEELHKVVGPVPPLDDYDAKWLWLKYCDAAEHNMSLDDALDWLQVNAPNSDFAIAIMAQRGFLRNKLGSE